VAEEVVAEEAAAVEAVAVEAVDPHQPLKTPSPPQPPEISRQWDKCPRYSTEIE